MTDKVIRVNVTTTKSKRVTVSSNIVANEITASPDTSAYYSRLAKNWAIAEGLVENIDYSSKHYAQESKASADMAKTYEIATQENYNMFMEASVNANSELQTNRDGALADIEGAKTSAVDSLNSVKDENIASIESKANEEIENFENLSEQEQNKIINLGIDTRANVDLSNLSTEGRTTGASLAMPSNKYIDLTLGASGTTYTAPANGWFYLNKVTAYAGEYINMNSSAGYGVNIQGFGNNSSPKIYLPVKKGDVVVVSYNATGSTTRFRFYYAQGEV